MKSEAHLQWCAEINWGRSCIWDVFSSLLVVQRSVNCILSATAVLWGFCQRKSSFILLWEENARDLLISTGGEHCPVQLIQWSQYVINHKYALIKSKTHSPVKGAVWPQFVILGDTDFNRQVKDSLSLSNFILNSQPRYRKSLRSVALRLVWARRGVRRGAGERR